MKLRRLPFQDVRLRRRRMKSPQVQPLDLSDGRARSIITTEAATQAWDPRWGLLIAATVGVFVFLLRMPITGHMAGIAIEARGIAANVTRRLTRITDRRCQLTVRLFNLVPDSGQARLVSIKVRSRGRRLIRRCVRAFYS